VSDKQLKRPVRNRQFRQVNRDKAVAFYQDDTTCFSSVESQLLATKGRRVLPGRYHLL